MRFKKRLWHFVLLSQIAVFCLVLFGSPRWFCFFVIGLAICLLTYGLQAFLFEIHPGNLWGLTYGILAAVLMVAVALFGLRRRLTRFTKRLGWGRGQAWVQFHVYAGTLFLVLMFMHSGFSLPNGSLAWWLFGLSIWVSVSGLFGVFLQKWIPKILTSGLAIEVLYERIPELITEIREKSEKLLQLCEEPVREFYGKNIAPSLLGPQVRLIYYIDITGEFSRRSNNSTTLASQSLPRVGKDLTNYNHTTKLNWNSTHCKRPCVGGSICMYHYPSS